jgi:hypothetical protein
MKPNEFLTPYQVYGACSRPNRSNRQLLWHRGLAAFIAIAASLIWSGTGGLAATLITTNSQGIKSKEDWSAAIWQANGKGARIQAGPGDTCVVMKNDIPVGILTNNNARIRNPNTPGQEVTFPADSLTLTPDTELRIKPAETVLNFLGVNGNPGLILDGGMINLALGGSYTVRGIVLVKSTGFIDGANRTNLSNGLELLAQLRGAGTLVFTRCLTNRPHIIACDANTFSGKWVVNSGWLVAQGKGSLGTNDITIDPKAPPGAAFEAYLDVPRQAVLEPRYDIQSAGTLTLKNGGMICLHQNCSFAAVNIEGAGLKPGMYPYADLVKSCPRNFLPNGSGSIIVRPFGAHSIGHTPTPAASPSAASAATSAATPAKHTGFEMSPAGFLILGTLVCIIGLLLGLVISLKAMTPPRSSTDEEQ